MKNPHQESTMGWRSGQRLGAGVPWVEKSRVKSPCPLFPQQESPSLLSAVARVPWAGLWRDVPAALTHLCPGSRTSPDVPAAAPLAGVTHCLLWVRVKLHNWLLRQEGLLFYGEYRGLLSKVRLLGSLF